MHSSSRAAPASQDFFGRTLVNGNDGRVEFLVITGWRSTDARRKRSSRRSHAMAFLRPNNDTHIATHHTSYAHTPATVIYVLRRRLIVEPTNAGAPFRKPPRGGGVLGNIVTQCGTW